MHAVLTYLLGSNPGLQLLQIFLPCLVHAAPVTATPFKQVHMGMPPTGQSTEHSPHFPDPDLKG